MSNLVFDPIKIQAKITDEVLVGFSTGKDSIVTMDLCFKYFKKVVPFFLYIVPGLEFQEQTLRKYERHYHTEIIRLPHPDASGFLRYGSFRPPDANVDIIEINDIYDYLRLETGITWIAAGERISDSIVRRAMIKNSGSTDEKRMRFYPLAYWKKKDVKNYIKKKKLYLPRDSRELGFSFKSLAGCELAKIKEIYPDEYKRILRMYPFSGAAVRRFEKYGK